MSVVWYTDEQVVLIQYLITHETVLAFSCIHDKERFHCRCRGRHTSSVILNLQIRTYQGS